MTWHPVQPSVLTIERIHSPWLPMLDEMPLPWGPVPGNSLGRRQLEQSEPVLGRVVLGCGSLVGCDDRRQVERITGFSLHSLGIHEPIAAHPHVVGGVR